jgi:paraquat-inducible protein A
LGAPPSHHDQQGGRAFIVFVLAFAAAVCLVLGLTLPVVQVTRLYFWTGTHSLASIIVALYTSHELFLAALITLFSVAFPALKLIYIIMAGTLMSANTTRRARWIRRIESLGKWSMLDVLLLALLVFYAKSDQFADAVALPGIYFFAASVILTMIAHGLIARERMHPES